MKKCLSRLTLLVLFFATLSIPLHAQRNTSSEDVFIFRTVGSFQGVRDHQVVLVPGSALYRALQDTRDTDIRPVSPILLGVKFSRKQRNLQGVPVSYLSKFYPSYYLGDSSETEVIAMGINENNIDSFRYRVVENDRNEIVPWSAIPELGQAYGAQRPYAVIGSFRSPGRQLFVEVKHVSDYSIRDGVIFDWRPANAPQLQQIAVFRRDSGRTTYSGLMTTDLYDSIDPISQIPVGFRFKQNDVSNIQLFFDEHYDIPYSAFIRQVSAGDSTFYALEFEFFDRAFQVHEQHFPTPGNYELIINRHAGYGELPESQALRIPFEVLPGSSLSRELTVEMVIAISTLLLIIICIIFVVNSRRSKRRLMKVAVENEIASFELKSLRNQLNPHFMFNALSSIQNLISKELTEKANYYLAKFSLLTRQLLESSNEEMVSLQEEMELIRNYLLMEQLRFNFHFMISVDERLDSANIEIPAMLLQPLVENAVKHGVSTLADKGLISVSVRVDSHHLVIELDDNGQGIHEVPSEGYGLGLTRQRIDLLNRLYTVQALSLTLSPLDQGTRATITLTNWIL